MRRKKWMKEKTISLSVYSYLKNQSIRTFSRKFDATYFFCYNKLSGLPEPVSRLIGIRYVVNI